MGNKYLSDVITIEQIINCKKNKICIFSGVGSGKNWFVENTLVKYGNILYVTSRRAKVNEILEEKIAQEFISWENDINDIVTTTNYGIQKLVMNEKFEGRLSEIIRHFSYVVIDEAHSIFADATYADAPFHVHTFLNYINEKYPAIKIILMTGTPEPMLQLVKDYYILDKREECINVVPKQIKFINKKQAIKILADISSNEKMIYFSNSARGLILGDKSLYQILIAAGIAENKISICMSENSISKNKKYFPQLEEICSQTKFSITQNRTIPKDSNILLTTSTLKEGVNIEDASIKIAFCESHLLSDIQQFAGRVRTTLNTLYIIIDAMQHDVNEMIYKSYMLESLFAGRKECSAANEFLTEEIKNTKGRLYTIAGYNSQGISWEEFMYGEYSLYSYGGEALKTFVKLIENKNQYVKFNHLTGKFNYYKNRFLEQKRVHYAIYGNGWKKDLEEYCKNYNIDYTPPVFEEEIDNDSICNYLQNKQDILLIDEAKDELINFLSNAFNISCTTPKITTFNKKFMELEIPFELKRGNTTKNNMNKRYLCVKKK